MLYLRHGTTDSSRVDQAPQVDLNDCNTQRVLSDAGRQQARELGATLQRTCTPVGEVIHSPLCRARESARLTFATQPQLLRAEPLLAYTANLTSEQKKPVIAATRALVSTPVPEPVRPAADPDRSKVDEKLQRIQAQGGLDFKTQRRDKAGSVRDFWVLMRAPCTCMTATA